MWAVAAAVALALAAFARLRRTWSDAAEPVALVLPLAVAAAVTAGPSPAAARGAAARLSALRAEPHRLLDPARRDNVFQVAAWPAALALGDEPAVRLVAAVASASALLAGYALFRSAAIEPAAALAGQAALAALAPLAVGPGPALYAHALPQALELLLLAHLVRRLGALEGARDNAAAFLYLLLAQSASALATLEAGLLAAVLALALAAFGSRRRALRLATIGALATAVVTLARYAPWMLDWPARPAPLAGEASWGPLSFTLTALAGGVAPAALPATTRAPLVVASALVAGVAAAVLARDAPSAVPPGLGLLAPAAAGAAGALVARVRSPRTVPAAPGSRS
jgi:hypothetical protein